MLIAILALAIIFGGLAATAALVAGWSLLAALVVYSAGGLLCVLMVLFYITATSAFQTRKTDLLRTDAIVGN